MSVGQETSLRWSSRQRARTFRSNATGGAGVVIRYCELLRASVLVSLQSRSDEIWRVCPLATFGC
jgi:hypothetical protein